MIVRTVADRQVIVCVSPEAAGFGIRLGMTLTQARALCAHVRHAPHQPARDRRAMEALARWLTRFTPVAALAFGEQDSELPVPQGIFLDVTGCARFFGGMEKLVERIQSALGRLGIGGRLAAAPTPGAAWALACAGHAGIVGEHDLPAALAPLPPAALRLSAQLVAALHHLGLSSIAQLARLPRDVLPARFGDELLHRLDQAMGRILEPLVPLEHHAPIETRMDFDGTVCSLEAIWAVGRHLLQHVCEQLSRRGSGARQLDIDLLRPSGPPLRKTILFSQPSRDPARMFHLLHCALEEVEMKGEGMEGRRHDGIEGRDAPGLVLEDEGFIGMRLATPVLQRLDPRQIFLLEQEHQVSELELGRLIDRLRLRLGESALMQAELVESHLPECAWKVRIPYAMAPTSNLKSGISDSKSYSNPLHSDHRCDLPPRPPRLLRVPREVRVMVTPSDDAEGKPASFSDEGRVHRIMHHAGPERIAACWWEGRDKTRDYFEVEDAAGRRFWIFRVLQTRKWYLHGEYG